MELRHQNLTRYIAPLREGGSLPTLGEADDEFQYVVKMRGAGHGPKALISELIGGEVARALGFKVPELVMLNLDEAFGQTEGDEEVQDLLKASRGLNLGLHFLSGSFTVDPYVNEVDPDLASRIVWLDAFLTNVDRTVRNTNMLWRRGELWLIDHGASLYFHHNWGDVDKAARTPFAYIADHALLARATRIEEADKAMRQRITPRTLGKIVDLIPDEWLQWPGTDLTPAQLRDGYKQFLTTRLANSRLFVDEAIKAHNNLKRTR